MKKEKKMVDNKFGFASFMLGLFSLIFFWLIIPALVMGIVSIIFAIIQLRKGGKKGFSIAGLILSILAILFAIILISKIVAFASLLAVCQQDPTAPGCGKLAQAFGVDQETLGCVFDPTAPGCEELLTNVEGGQIN